MKLTRNSEGMMDKKRKKERKNKTEKERRETETDWVRSQLHQYRRNH